MVRKAGGPSVDSSSVSLPVVEEADAPKVSESKTEPKTAPVTDEISTADPAKGTSLTSSPDSGAFSLKEPDAAAGAIETKATTRPTLKIEIPEDLDTSEIDALNAMTPKGLDRRWDLANPKDAIEVLDKFATNHKEEIERDRDALPGLQFWESRVDHTFENADVALNALRGISEGVSPSHFDKACRELFKEGGESIAIRGVTITDPAIVLAVRVLRGAKHPLTVDETLAASRAFEHRPKAQFCKEDIKAILAKDHERSEEKFNDCLGWYDLLARQTDDPEAAFAKAMAEPDEAGHNEIETKVGGKFDILNPVLLRALEIIQAKDDPANLSMEDQLILGSMLEESGGPENIGFTRECVHELAERFKGAEVEELNFAVELLDSLSDDPKELAIAARSILSASEVGAPKQLRRSTGVMDLRLTMNDTLRSALRIIANEVDKPDFNVPGFNNDVAKYYCEKKGIETLEYTFENVEGLVGAMHEFADFQSERKLEQLSSRYSLEVDPKKSVQENLDSMQAQFDKRLEDYEAIEFTMSAIKRDFEEDTALGESIPFTDVDRPSSFPDVQQVEKDQVVQFRRAALRHAENEEWPKAELDLAKLGCALTRIYAKHGEAGIKDLDLDPVLKDLTDIVKRAEISKQWTVLDIVYSVLTLGGWAAAKAWKSSHSEQAIEEAAALKERIIDVRGGEPLSEIESLQKLRRTMENHVLPNVKDAQGSEFMKFFTDYLDAAIYRHMQDDITHQIGEQLKHLEKGGSASSVTFEVGAGWGIPKVLELGTGMSITLGVKGGDDRRIREGSSISLDVHGKGSVGITTISGKLGESKTKGRTFKNVEDFVKFHRDDILISLLRDRPGILKTIADSQACKKAEDLNKLTKSQMDRFDHSARLMGLIGNNDGFVVDPNRKPVPTKTATTKEFQSVGVKLGFEKLGVALGLKHADTKTEFFKRVDLLQYLKSNLGSLDTTEAPADPKNISLPAAPRNESMEAAKERIAALSTKAERVEAIIDSMNGLHAEFTSYCQVVRHYDTLKTRFSLIHKSPLEKQMQEIKHSFQKDRGVDNRGDYIRASVTTHANLVALLANECSPEEMAQIDLSPFEADYSFPRLVLTKKHIDRLHKSVTKTGTSKELSFSVEASAGWGVKGTVDGTISEIKNNSNPDNDGVYLNLSLEASADTQAALSALITKLETINASAIADAGGMGDAISNALKMDIPIDADNVIDIGLTGEMSGKVQLNFVKNHKLSLQYIRVTDKQKIGGSIEGIPLGGGALMSAGLSHAEERHFYERIGNDTLTYVRCQFNGFKLAGGDWEEGWTQWCLDGSNRKQLRKLAQNMATEDTNSFVEMSELGEELTGADRETYDNLLTYLNGVKGKKINLDDDGPTIMFAELMGKFFDATREKNGLRRSVMMKNGWKPIA